MVCFCKATLGPLEALLPTLDASLSVSVAESVQIQALASWLGGLGLPAAPWEPDEAWLDLQLPTLSLSASAVATLSAFAQLRAGALALGIDLLVPAQATAFARLAATVDARLSAMASVGAGLSLNPIAWTQASASLTACAQVNAALSLGLFVSPPPMPSLGVWRPFLLQLRPLLPVIALSAQLGISAGADLSVSLGAMLRVMLRIGMPSLGSMSLMASLTASLSAIASISASLGVNAMTLGLPQIQAMVSAQISATASAVLSVTGLTLPALVLQLPRLSYSPALMAPSAVVSAAMSLNLPPISWQVPAVSEIAVLSVGLPVVAFSGSLSAALNVPPATMPCPICDAGAILSAALSV